jgi:FkbM family methyltransferase
VPDEPDEQQLIQRIVRPEDVVYDIGANIGLYTSLFSRLASKVVAFEPNPGLLRTLRLTTANLANVKIVPVALADTDGNATLYVPNDHTMGSLADYTGSEELLEWKERIGLTAAETVQCETSTLDSLIAAGLPLPDFIKCDVEGAEFLVFRGAQKTLASAGAPFVLFEVLEMCSSGFGVDKLAAAKFLEELGYSLFDVGPRGNLRPMVPSPHRVNVLAIPPGRIAALGDLLN